MTVTKQHELLRSEEDLEERTDVSTRPYKSEQVNFSFDAVQTLLVQFNFGTIALIIAALAFTHWAEVGFPGHAKA
jgi:hypothetical protein